MGKFVKAVIGAALVVGVTLLTGGTLTAALIAGGLSLLSSTVLGPKTGGSGSRERQAAETTLQLGETPRQVLFGKAATAGSLLDGFNYGGQDGTDWEVLLIALADHECHSLDGFYVNDAYVAFTGNGAVTGYNSQLEVYFLPGTATQSWPSLVTTHGPGWTSADKCKGVACVAVAYKADKPDAANPVWPGGRPRFLWVLKGKKCYQARKDSTVAGGSGSHRWADPSTWEWTDNAAECRYQFQRGIYALDQVDQPDMLLLGRGLSEVEAPPARSIVHANTCDETVSLAAGGTEKRYTFNGMIGADEDFLTAEGYFAAAMGGIIRQPDGGIEVEPGQGKAVSAEITDMDILNLTEVAIDAIRGEADNDWVNTVVPRYVEPEQKWKSHAAPVRRVYADVIADGGPRTTTLELKPVTSSTQAQRLAEIVRRLGRLPYTGGVTLGPRFCELEEGDWIGWTSARHFGGARKVFRIESFDRNIKWHMSLQLREIAASVYSWTSANEGTAGSEAIQQDPPGDLTAPDTDAWNLSGGQIDGVGSAQPALIILGATDYDYAESVRFEYRVDGDSEWTDAGTSPPSITRKIITGVADGTSYEVAVSYIVEGIPSARLILGPATAGALTVKNAADELTARSVAFPLTSNDTSITIAAFTGISVATGQSVSIPSGSIGSLSSGTKYGVFRNLNAATWTAAAFPAAAQWADPALTFIGWQQTSTGGTYSPPATPPGGYGGSGNTFDPKS